MRRSTPRRSSASRRGWRSASPPPRRPSTAPRPACTRTPRTRASSSSDTARWWWARRAAGTASSSLRSSAGGSPPSRRLTYPRAMALTCLVTIHGIGFQQPPREGVAGYADGLHEHLRDGLGASLGDDPNRDRGPVYVQSTWPPEDPPPGPTGLLGMLRQIEDDVAAYVARNELRERLRAFVREALTRLLLREDVARVVVNGHSNGTVVAFDVLSQLPPPLLDGVS